MTFHTIITLIVFITFARIHSKDNCKFPFRHNKAIHYRCIDDGTNEPWCLNQAGHKESCSLKCKFPFELQGRRYNKCTRSGHARPWCSIDSKYKGRYIYCDDLKQDSDECVFPFIYRGEYHSKCVRYGSEKAWCSLKRFHTGNETRKFCYEGENKGGLCKFPFRFEGKLHKGCVYSGSTRPWCSTYHEYIGIWKYCTPQARNIHVEIFNFFLDKKYPAKKIPVIDPEGNNSTSIKVNGSWTPWSSWSSCSKSCESGERTQSRSCIPPKYGGHPCLGFRTNRTSCNTQSCPKWLEWLQWSKCSKTCDGGKRSRSRSCSVSKNGRNLCEGVPIETGNCNTAACPIWSPWSGWSSCSRTCGNGYHTRYRTCTNPGGIKGLILCHGVSKENKKCQFSYCPVDGMWTKWSSWSSCSKSCQFGERTQSRSCVNPKPKYGGRPCSGSSTRRGSCNTHACPVDCKFKSWSKWSSCSAGCGYGLTKRNRSQIKEMYGGKPCSGSLKESKRCYSGKCYVYQPEDCGK